MATTHVFIVDATTFSYHLQYMFAGTGAKDDFIDFNNLSTSTLDPRKELKLAGMMADCARIRANDYVIFYLQRNMSSGIKEGKFYGVFKVRQAPFFLDNNDANQFLNNELRKSLTFRILIKPHKVYQKGATEWEALDEIKNINSPNQMLWSLIYRKLKGNRGNTMITLYESERLRLLISAKNNHQYLTSHNYDFDSNNELIITSNNSNIYTGRTETVNLLPRLIEKYSNSKQFEAHLQEYILQNIENISVFQNLNIDWIGNEVSCGVGMQRIDILLSVDTDPKKIIPIELKSIKVKTEIIQQMQRYINWLEQYYVPNIPSLIEPMIIVRKTNNKNSSKFNIFIQNLRMLNTANSCYVRYVEFDIDTINSSILFTEHSY